MSGAGDPVEEYLDQLYRKLRATPREGRRTLAEAEDHLREGVADGLAAGLSEREAAEAAVSSFGSVAAVVRAHEGRFPSVSLFASLAVSAWRLISVGLLAIGASGLLASAMNVIFGPQFVGGAPTLVGASAANCRHWLANWPLAHGCAQASMLEASADAVSLRVAAGVLGLIMLGVYLLVFRGAPRVLPEGFVPTVAVTLFGTAAVGLAGLTVVAPAASGLGGPGLYLSGAIAALAVAVGYLPALRRTLLRAGTRT
jgi:hypothetical protein